MKKRQKYNNEDLLNEEWCDISGYEGIYKISSIGRIRSLPRIVKKGLRTYYTEDLILSASLAKGYKLITLQKNKSKRVKSLHILVAEAFIPNTGNKPYINHINSIKSDNRVENLEWCTQKENVDHAWENNLIKVQIGSQKPNAKFTEKDILLIRKIFSNEPDCKQELAYIYNVTPQCINSIVNNKSWTHI